MAEQFVREYADQALRYIISVLDDVQEAEDIFVEVFKVTVISGDLTWECLKQNADKLILGTCSDLITKTS